MDITAKSVTYTLVMQCLSPSLTDKMTDRHSPTERLLTTTTTLGARRSMNSTVRRFRPLYYGFAKFSLCLIRLWKCFISSSHETGYGYCYSSTAIQPTIRVYSTTYIMTVNVLAW